ncbi:ATP-dependent RNA helicase DDX60 [Diplonema papillatum]|nr:ATP-dependent RNA helicase DDX60 [Diplonema papillatum]
MATYEDVRPLDPEALSAQEFVSDAYGRWIPERLDLFHDMSAEEGFLIDGDALILEAFCNWNVEWPEGCGQQLHVTYLVENLMRDFTCRDAIFAVVFFDCNRALYAKDASKVLARDLIIRHLQASLPKIVFTFKSWWEPAWGDFLDKQIPSFILINDAEQVQQVLFPTIPTDPAALTEHNKDLNDLQFFLRSFMVDCVRRRLHAVYTTRLVRKDCFIHAFVVRANSKRFMPMGKEINAAAIHKACQELFGDDGAHALVALEKQEFASAGRFGVEGSSAWPTLPGLENVDFRVQFFAPALKKVYEDASVALPHGTNETKEDLVKAFLIHLLVLAHLPISARAHTLTEFSQSESQRSVYFRSCDFLFKTILKEASAGSTSSAADLATPEGKARDAILSKSGALADLWDFRLNRKVIAVLLQSEGKLEGPEGMLAMYAAAWKVISSGKSDETEPALRAVDSVPSVAGKDSFNFALVPSDDALVNNLVSDLPLNEIPEAQAGKTLSSLVEKQRWLQRSQLWAAQDLEEVIRGDDLFKATQAAFADAYDTSMVSSRKKKKMEMRMDRARAKFLHAIQTGAESMSGGFLPHSESRVITKAADEKKDTRGGGGKAKQGSKAAEIAEKNKVTLEQKEKEAQERAWSNFYSRLEVKKEMSVDKLDYCASEISKFISSKKTKDKQVLTRARVERLKLLERLWLAECKEHETKKNMKIAVDLFRGVHEMFSLYFATARAFKKTEAAAAAAKEEENKKKKDKKEKKKDPAAPADEPPPVYKPLFGDDETAILKRILTMLGLKENLKRVDIELAAIEGVPYTEIKYKYPSNAPKNAKIVSRDSEDENSRSHVRFQMQTMGHLFERSTGEEDRRVVFNPDPWQKEMLDYVDAKESILCCAPTSAGKTFISYYCIKEVMFSSNENVVVYVAPTRALCNQAAQDVYSIFGHKKYSANGWSLFGILGGGNYVQPLPPMGGPFMTQVLITIPSVFEHVMLAPKYQQWAKRVKYVIFDEVHSVDTSGEGHLWERLLMCSRAPFLALSATVGNAEDFRGWLSRTQDLMEKQDREKGAALETPRQVRGVYWNQRWNDLEKYTFTPRTKEERKNFRPKISKGPFANDNMKQVHPFSTVTRTMLEKFGEFPKDLPLVPSESLQLFDAMKDAYDRVSRQLLGSWSDDEGNRFKIEGSSFTGKKGALKGIQAERVLKDAPPAPTHPKRTTKKTSCYVFEGGAVWLAVNDSAECECVMKKGNDVICCVCDHEIDGGIMEAMDGPSIDPLSGNEVEEGALSPEQYFRKDITITQTRARAYEAALKSELMNWVRKGEKDTLANAMVNLVMEKLGGGLRTICEEAEQVATAQDTPLDTREFIENNFTDLLLCLNGRNMLPALVFNFDQGMCEDLAKKICSDLERAEEEKKSTPEWASFVKKRQELLSQQKKEVKAFKAASANKGASKKKDEEGEGGKSGGTDEKEEFEEPELCDYSIPDILPEYAFSHPDRGDGMSTDDFDRMVKDIGSFERGHFLLRALERGIGVHHAGLPVKYRNNVERLFRMKKLKVVVATDGLALGIHSPCRTVVLAGDNVRLSTMQFRQMSGRAGRRGQDYVGYVVFYGIPESKIVRLMTSGLPTLKGHVSVDATTVLRMSLLHSYQNSARGRDKIEVHQETVRNMSECMTHPLFLLGRTLAQGDKSAEVGRELYNKQVRLQWRYIIDYLLREALITPTGSGLYLPGLVTRSLYSFNEVHMAPAGLVLASLIKNGVLLKVCSTYTRSDNASIVAQMTKFLAILFSKNSLGWKLEVHRSIAKNPEVVADDCPHEVVLPAINDLFGGEIWRTLQATNAAALHIFSDCIRRMAEEAEKVHGKDVALPLSKTSFQKPAGSSSGGILDDLTAQAIDVKARSPFIAVCGLNDDFHCVDDLTQSLRSTLHIDEDTLPIVDYIDLWRKDPDDRWVRMNAASYDYIIEGPQQVDGSPTRLFLEEFNGMTQSQSWYVLNQFATAVTNVADLVERLAPAWIPPEKTFTCCNLLCPPQNCVFPASAGLYKCNDCDKEGVNTWMCTKCYEEGEECQTKDSELKCVRNKHHVFFRHVHDKFVQTMSHIAADLEPIGKDLGRAERPTSRKKKLYAEVSKPKRPILQKQQRPAGRRLFVHRKK